MLTTPSTAPNNPTINTVTVSEPNAVIDNVKATEKEVEVEFRAINPISQDPDFNQTFLSDLRAVLLTPQNPTGKAIAHLLIKHNRDAINPTAYTYLSEIGVNLINPDSALLYRQNGYKLFLTVACDTEIAATHLTQEEALMELELAKETIENSHIYQNLEEYWKLANTKNGELYVL